MTTVLKYLDNNPVYLDQNIEMSTRAKKRRLDHLTWEEKIQRKKLRNRVAAQTSRDRKKAKMEQMEQSIQQLFDKNEALMDECRSLKAANERLLDENAALYNQLRLSATCTNCSQNRSVECATLNGSAVSTILRQKGRAIHSAAALDKVQVMTLWKIVLSCLLYRTCSTNSIPMSTLTVWSNSHRASCKISPETWKQLLRKQIIKNQSVINKISTKEWWGNHQHSWNPVQLEMKC